MSIFGSRAKGSPLNFTTRSEAFGYMLAYCLERGDDPLQAADKADAFAAKFANNMGLPVATEPEAKGIDKYLSMATKIANYIEEHPKVIEYGVPAVTFVAGLFTGKKVEQHVERDRIEAELPPINFDEIKD